MLDHSLPLTVVHIRLEDTTTIAEIKQLVQRSIIGSMIVNHKDRMIGMKNMKDQKGLHMINGQVMTSNVNSDVKIVTKKVRLTISLSEKEATEESATVSVQETSIENHLGAVHTKDLDINLDKRYQVKTMHQFQVD